MYMRLRIKALGLAVDRDDDDDGDDDDDDTTALPRLTYPIMRFRVWGLALPMNMIITFFPSANTLVTCVNHSKRGTKTTYQVFHTPPKKKTKPSKFKVWQLQPILVQSYPSV